ncbi:MAG: DUF1801 domain-containing protein [Spirochaetales bacterium]|nr:DUF1801 domain-containing protein [Spirochaetales bacterium]
MRSNAKTVREYLNSLPGDRREIIEKVRKIILKNLPEGYEETMQYGMIGYVVPISRYPQGYLGDKSTPLPYASLASQKNYLSLYLMGVYGDADSEKWLKQAYKKSGKKLDMGKSCIRFKRLDDLALDVIAEALARIPVDSYIRKYELSRKRRDKDEI